MSSVTTLRDLRSLRQAPAISTEARQTLRSELNTALAVCDWFTIGVMAPDAEAALTALRQCERALGWTPLADSPDPLPAGPVFLKGNQRSGGLLIRTEEGLGEGLLISGHQEGNGEAGDTWGPLPLDFFAND
ncbi:MAG: DUF1824 family protein [Cyanobacteriota bacterium]